MKAIFHFTTGDLLLRKIDGTNFLFTTKKNGKITNTIYQEICEVSKATATRDLKELIEDKNLLERIGDVGKGTTYKLIGS